MVVGQEIHCLLSLTGRKPKKVASSCGPGFGKPKSTRVFGLCCQKRVGSRNEFDDTKARNEAAHALLLRL